jgi:hypothetical protein
MSAYVHKADKTCSDTLNDPQTNSRIKLLWHRIGEDDYLLTELKKFESTLDRHGIQRDFVITEGNHSWPVWRH